MDTSELRQGSWCMDSLGNKAGGVVGLYRCHGNEGNQVCVCVCVCVHACMCVRACVSVF